MNKHICKNIFIARFTKRLMEQIELDLSVRYAVMLTLETIFFVGKSEFIQQLLMQCIKLMHQLLRTMSL